MYLLRLNLEFFSKDVLYNDINFSEHAKNMLESMDILEKAKKARIKNDNLRILDRKDEDIWSKLGDFLNPFKCGKN